MKRLTTLIAVLAFTLLGGFTNLNAQCGDLYIAGAIDGPLAGGTPKALQLCASAAIADLSVFGVESVTNGGGSSGAEEYTLAAAALNAGDCIWITSDLAQFSAYFGFDACYESNVVNVNGDDAFILYCSGAVSDIFGDLNTDGTGEAWEYLDSWAVSNDMTANPTFDAAEWTYGGPNALDGEADNASAATPYPNTAVACPVIAFDCPDIAANIGDACDDMDATTENDVVLADCTCEGTAIVFDCPTEMVNIGDACDDGDAMTENDVTLADCTCAGTAIVLDCPALMANIGDACDDGDASTINDTVSADCVCAGVVPGDCPAAYINEFHYDNAGGDLNEFVEIVMPAGSDPTQIIVDLYNGNGGITYATITLSSAEFVSTDGVLDYYVWAVVPQNGNDGISVACTDGTLLQFISYEGAFMATDGPAAGAMATDVGVAESSATTDTQAIQFDGAGGWIADCTATPGAPNDLASCTALPVLGCTDATACNYDPAADTDDGTCFSVGDTCDDGDAATVGDVYTDCDTCAGVTDVVEGCTDDTACNYDPAANVDNGTCIIPTGCDECDGAGGIIDNPEVGDACDDGDANTTGDVYVDCGVCAGTAPVTCATAFINEFHYDDDGADANEFVEVALALGDDPTSVTITLYNGSNGTAYSTYTLTSADLVGSDANYDYYVWYPASIQNGNPDGIALSCTDGTLYQFISYEGTFMATDGDASGTMSTDIGVAEDGTGSETSSIQFDGTSAWGFNCDATAGGTNDLSTCAQCPDGSSPGDTCDDGDDTTENDTVQADCSCVGTPIVTPTDCDANIIQFPANGN